MSPKRELDLVVFGATGFVGRLVARYLAGHAPAGLRVGLAGRSAQRLAGVRATLGAPASAWPLIEADITDDASLRAVAHATRVLVSTAGPYRPHGVALVEACAAAGTHYADLTGELLFVRNSIERCHELAVRTGSRIVHCCGIDSVPSDLGVWLVHRAARADGAGDLTDTTLVVTAFKAGISGGTIASGKLQLDEARANAHSRLVLDDPYALSPDRGAEPDLGDEVELMRPRSDPELGIWIGPFLMAGINTRIVRRSNALQDWAYGRRFRYREVTGFGTGPAAPVKAAAASAGLAALYTGLAFGPTRSLLDRVLPAPGAGPSERVRRNGYFGFEVHAGTSTGARYVGRVAASGDPGYAATSVMLGESALALALDSHRLPHGAGVLTPATALGGVLVDRLRSSAFTVTAQRTPD